MKCIHRASRAALLGLLASALVSGSPSEAANAPVGINVVLNQDVTESLLADLGRYGTVLDVIPQLHAVTLRGYASDLAAIRALSSVVAAEPDAAYEPANADVSDLSYGANEWSLDAINVTDAGSGRTVAYDGEGVYVAVLDSGLPSNWRTYFPEERIDTIHARAFGGGGGNVGTVSSQPQKWEHDTEGHGCAVTSIILGFRYVLSDPVLPATFNGVAPKATVIPVQIRNAGLAQAFHGWGSTLARGLVYVGDLKAGGELGVAPLVANLSIQGPPTDPLVQAALDYAIARGVIVVGAAGNVGDGGMRVPGAYAPVISVGATGWAGQLPTDDPTLVVWTIRDVPEDDAAQHPIAPFSSRELPGQDLDVVAPGFPIPVAWTQDGRPAYAFLAGTSFSCPAVAGVAALMLQKNPGLTQSQIESILEATAMPLAPGSVDLRLGALAPSANGHYPTFDDLAGVSIFTATVSWGANATGHGLLQADAALSATPTP